jgi:aminomethyltransferase
MKTTPFTHLHTQLGAKMAPFAGYNMPISYSGINEEHATVRNNAGVFDVSHMGEFIVKGPGALELIQRVTSNDASKLVKGKAQYTCLTNDTGGIVDDLLVYCLEDGQSYMLAVNASNIEKDWNWISERNTEGVEMYNISEQTGLLAVQGPNATRILQELTDIDLAGMKYYTFERGTFAGVENVIVSATGYTGSGGVELYFEEKDGAGERIWNEIFRVGGPKGMKPIGLAARDTLRLDKGFCLYGNDIDDETSPLEAGLGWITKFTKDFTARPILEGQKTAGAKRRLVGIEMIDRGIPRKGYTLQNAEGKTIGTVTSGTQSPTLGKAIGMALIEKPFDSEGSDVFVMVRDKPLKAQVVKMPFVV